jgi:hypothetical protein
MKRIAISSLVALLVLAAVGVATAGKYDEGTLVGTWDFDMVKMYQQAMEAAGQEMPPGMDIETVLQGSYMRITFNKDGTYAVDSKAMGSQNAEAGTWEVVEKEGDTITVKSTNPDKGQEQVVKVTFIDSDHIDAVVTDGEHEMVMSAERFAGKDKKDKKAEKE